MELNEEERPEPYLVCGEWRYRPVPAHHHSIQRTALAVAAQLGAWQTRRQEPDFEVLNNAWFQLRPHPPTLACLPLAVVPGRLPTLESNWVPVIPLVAAEVHVGPDQFGSMRERILEYLACGVALVWCFVPDWGAVSVYRHGEAVRIHDSSKTFTGDPELPGFSCPVADFFR